MLRGVEFWSVNDWEKLGSGLVVWAVEAGDERSAASNRASSVS